MIKKLKRKYRNRYGVPIINRVDTTIFTRTYFAYCMDCLTCHDICCSYGCDVSIEEVKRLNSITKVLEDFSGVTRINWFSNKVTKDKDYPGGSFIRTKVVDGSCIFLQKTTRGCSIHSFCVEQGIDFHEFKPMVCCLFAVTFNDGLLSPSNEIKDNSLFCLGEGPSLFRGTRDNLLFYFDEDLTSELDEVEKTI